MRSGTPHKNILFTATRFSQKVCAACKDNSIVIVETPTGKENLTIELQDPVDFLQLHGEYLLVVTTAAEIFVW